MKKLILVGAIAAVISLSGCTATQYIAAGVNSYCSLPVENRAVNREAFALAIAPNRVTVDCK